jgi:hypothetical protein
LLNEPAQAKLVSVPSKPIVFMQSLGLSFTANSLAASPYPFLSVILQFCHAGRGGGLGGALVLSFSNSNLSRSISVRSQTDFATTTPEPTSTALANMESRISCFQYGMGSGFLQK